jgi:tRNA-Thr(GGU) m(6)t(6)A37 methyltransferase TsaA
VNGDEHDDAVRCRVDDVTYQPIGVIRTPFAEPAGMPVQAVAGAGVRGTIELRPELEPGLQDLAEMSHLILIYHLDRMEGSALVVTPFLDDRPHGIFATRSPKRPNPIGLSTVRLMGIRGNVLDVEDLDILDGTPLLDMKPYVPALDDRANVRTGWYEHGVKRVHEVRSDDRFAAASPGEADDADRS